MNDIYILLCQANNGFGMAVVAAPPGDHPYRWLAEWFARKHYKQPFQAAREYTIVDRLDGVANHTGVIAVCEYFDGAQVYGRGDPKRYD